MSHELVEKTAGLASRVDTLVTHHVGPDCRELEKLQDRLEKLTLATIVAQLKDSEESYKAAVAALTTAIDTIGDAERRIDRISEVIRLTAKAASLVEAAVRAAA